jgi:hypothetical protein
MTMYTDDEVRTIMDGMQAEIDKLTAELSRLQAAGGQGAEPPPVGMKWFYCDTSADSCNGTQSWRIAGRDLQDAMAKFEAGDCEIVDQEIEVTKVGEASNWRTVP